MKSLDIQIFRAIAIIAVVANHSYSKGETVRKLRPEPAFTQAIRPKS